VAMRRPARAGVILLALTLGAAACGGGDDGDGAGDETTTTTAESSPDDETTTTLSPEDEVLAAYERAQAAIASAFDPADPDNVDLLATHAGAQLERIQTRLTDYQLEGLSDVAVSKETAPQVLTVTGSTATVEDCQTEVLQLMDSATRAPQGEPRTLTGLTQVDLELVDGAWKIVDGRLVEETC
jgi:major membrane immunogen (membrane-anchored lipoprotein)